jgi:phage-related protein
VAEESSKPKEAAIAWEGDSLGVIRCFPDEVRQNLGHQLRLLQQGERPTDYRPVTTIGPGVFELRDQDERAWYRVIYLSRIRDVIHVLHCFEKKSREIPRKDVQLAQQRLKAVRARMEEERKHAKPGH